MTGASNIDSACFLEARAILAKRYTFVTGGVGYMSPAIAIDPLDAEAVLRRAAEAEVDPIAAAHARIRREHEALTILLRLGAHMVSEPNIAGLRKVAQRRSVELLDVAREVKAECERRFAKAGLLPS